jgi:methylenetetrahydrofolate dehydrogenase (NADP+) / methenyltetrahydrofolate cyclohydrolase
MMLTMRVGFMRVLISVVIAHNLYNLCDGHIRMPATIIDCKEIADEFEKQVKSLYAKLEQEQTMPTFATILPNDDRWSAQYVNMLGRKCEELGIVHRRYHPKTDTQIIETIETVNADESIDGVLLLSPLRPESRLDPHEISNSILHHKDVEGLSFPHKGKLDQRYEQYAIVPPTAMAIVSTLHHYGYDFMQDRESKIAVIINRSEVIGKPLRNMLEHDHMTVVAVDEYVPAQFIERLLPAADLIVSAVPSQEYRLNSALVKPGAAVIAVTSSNIEADGESVYDDLLGKCSILTARMSARNNIGQITSILTMRNLFYLVRHYQE